MATINPYRQYRDLKFKKRGRPVASLPPLHACHWAGCGASTRSASGYCPRHLTRMAAGGATWPR